jgi:hypothetical protein
MVMSPVMRSAASPKMAKDSGRWKDLDTTVTSTIGMANGTSAKIYGVISNIQFTINKRLFTVPKVYIMDLFKGVEYIIGHGFGKKYRLTQFFAENTATGIDVDAKPPAMFTLGDRLTEDETRRMLADHAMLVMQGIASHASAFADDMMFASQPDRANKFHELKQRKLETEAGMGIGKDIKLRMSDIRALKHQLPHPGDLLSLRTDAPAGPTYPLDGANSPPIWTIVFYLLRKGVKPPVLVLCLAFRHRKVQLYY